MKATDMNYSDLNQDEKYRLKNQLAYPQYGEIIPNTGPARNSSLTETLSVLAIAALMVIGFYVAMPDVAAQLWNGLLEAIELIKKEMK